MAEQSKSPPDISRYKFDLEQAHVMSRKLRKHVSPESSSTVNQDVDLGLQGLEDAKLLVEKGSLQDALKLYELSIELLIKCLRSGGDKDLLKTQVRHALAEAEALKSRISKQTSANTTESSSSSWSSLASQLSSAISRGSPVLAPSPTNIYPTSSVQTASSKKQTSHPQQAQSAQKKRSDQRRRLDYDNDPLVKQVKADLYVDPSELQDTKWNDIAGLERAKQSLKEAAILPLLRPDLFTGLRKPQNVLLYGPPGTGKTMLVKAVAHESDCLLFACSASTLTSKWHGEGEKLVRTMFHVARDVAPSLIFIDEMDAMLSSRSDGEHEASRRFKTEFMVQMDGISSDAGGILVVGCTNCPWNIDDAILRRFPRRILIPLPDKDARAGLLRALLKKAGKHSLTDRQVVSLASRMEGYSGSDIQAMATEASFGPIRAIDVGALQTIDEKQLRPISLQDFESALKETTKSVSDALLNKYDEWEKHQPAKSKV